jgi:hypothetical protein
VVAVDDIFAAEALTELPGFIYVLVDVVSGGQQVNKDLQVMFFTELGPPIFIFAEDGIEVSLLDSAQEQLEGLRIAWQVVSCVAHVENDSKASRAPMGCCFLDIVAIERCRKSRNREGRCKTEPESYEHD